MYKLPDNAHYMDTEFAEYLIKKGEPYETMRAFWKVYTLREILEAVYNRGYHHGYNDGYDDGEEDHTVDDSDLHDGDSYIFNDYPW